MIEIGTRVFHTGVQANGEVIEIDETKRDKYKVRFFWAHYVDVLHTPPRPLRKVNPYGPNWYGNPSNRKWQWCYSESLVEGPKPLNSPQHHRIALVNHRITDKRLNLVGEIPFASDGPADIYIRYGGNLNHNGGFCINEKIVIDKWEQMRIMGEDLCMPTVQGRPVVPDNWIIKPKRSCGGKNIRLAKDSVARPGLDYYQKRFPKVREFRAHCFLWNDNPVPFIQEKIIEDPDQLCWNKKQGGSFRYVYQDGLDYGKYNNLDEDLWMKMLDMSVDALKRLKYDSGGIDFGMDAEGNMKIFEVNSAMGLRERSLFTYKDVYWKLANLDIDEYRRTRWTI